MEDLPIYSVNGGGKTACICAYDIFGYSTPNSEHPAPAYSAGWYALSTTAHCAAARCPVRANCDWLGQQGLIAVLPDFFRGATAHQLRAFTPANIGKFGSNALSPQLCAIPC